MIDYFKVNNLNLKNVENIESELIYGDINKNKPFISIMIPTYKRLKLLQEAVLSIINQHNYIDYEIIIVDNDNNKEFMPQILEFIKSINSNKILYYVNRKNIGVFPNWNKCITLANGTFMTILSDDDYLLPNYLDNMTKYLNNDKTIDRIECKYITRDEREKTIKQNIKQLIKMILGFNSFKDIGWQNKLKSIYYNKIINKSTKLILPEMYLMGCFTAPHAQLYKVELAKKIYGFNQNHAPISDYIFNCQYVIEFGKCIQLNKYLAVYRILQNSSLNEEVINKCMESDKEFTKYLLNKYNNLRNTILRFLFIKNRFSNNIFYKVIYYLYKLTYNTPF
jgi:glycosyltransferase involved in cell wall biosynthesis